MKILMRASQTPFDNFSPFDTMLLDKLWANVGNLLFPFSILRNIASDETSVDIYSKIDSKDADYINENYDMLLIPLANAFRESFENQLKQWTELVKKVKIPCVVVGVGIQCGNDFTSDTKFDFDDTVYDFCGAVASKSALIGVRGQRTYDYLKRLGFGAVTRIIGCPSMFMFGKDLPVPKKSSGHEKLKISINGKNSDSEQIKQFLFNNDNDYIFIPQETKELKLLYVGMPFTPPGKENNVYPVDLANSIYAGDKIKFPINVPTWLDLLRTVDLSFGTRIHGNIAAALAGVPAFILATDSRITELADYHNIPYKTAESFDFSKSFEYIYEETDFSAVNKDHDKRYENFVDFLKTNSLNPVELPNNYFDKKISEINFYPPVESILTMGKEEQARRLNNFYGHIIRKDKKAADEITELKKKCEQLTKKNEKIAYENKNLYSSLEQISSVTEKFISKSKN